MLAGGTDVSEIDQSALPDRPFSYRSGYRIALSEEAHAAICAHAAKHPTDEVCGVLVGQVLKDGEGPHLEIAQVIRGEHAARGSAHVTFTHETWAHIAETMDSKFAGQRIVGWYHTHPGFGVFLSPQDDFIHRGFFNQPWQVAFVLDPTRGEEGFFVWREGHPSRLHHYWCGGRERWGARPEEDVGGATREERKRRGSGVTVGMLLLVVVLIGLLAREELRLSRRAGQSSAPPAGQATTSGPQRAPDLDEIRGRIAQHPLLRDLHLRVDVVGRSVLCSGEACTWQQKEALSDAIGGGREVDLVDVRRVRVTHRYRVEPGDTLSGIAGKVYGRASLWRPIVRANPRELRDPNLVRAGSSLRIAEVGALGTGS